MFDKSSLKLGLDHAVLKSYTEGGGKDSAAPTLKRDEIESLLKRGAYHVFLENSESHQLNEDDIDVILKRDSHVVVYKGGARIEGEEAEAAAAANATGADGGAAAAAPRPNGNSFSKASFMLNGETIDLQAADFWERVGLKADATEAELPRQRARKPVDYAGERVWSLEAGTVKKKRRRRRPSDDEETDRSTYSGESSSDGSSSDSGSDGDSLSSSGGGRAVSSSKRSSLKGASSSHGRAAPRSLGKYELPESLALVLVDALELVGLNRWDTLRAQIDRAALSSTDLAVFDRMSDEGLKYFALGAIKQSLLACPVGETPPPAPLWLPGMPSVPAFDPERLKNNKSLTFFSSLPLLRDAEAMIGRYQSIAEAEMHAAVHLHQQHKSTPTPAPETSAATTAAVAAATAAVAVASTVTSTPKPVASASTPTPASASTSATSPRPAPGSVPAVDPKLGPVPSFINLFSCAHCSKADTVLSKCGACQCVTYCSRECQVAAWKVHRPLCARWAKDETVRAHANAIALQLRAKESTEKNANKPAEEGKSKDEAAKEANKPTAEAASGTAVTEGVTIASPPAATATVTAPATESSNAPAPAQPAPLPAPASAPAPALAPAPAPASPTAAAATSDPDVCPRRCIRPAAGSPDVPCEILGETSGSRKKYLVHWSGWSRDINSDDVTEQAAGPWQSTYPGMVREYKERVAEEEREEGEKERKNKKRKWLADKVKEEANKKQALPADAASTSAVGSALTVSPSPSPSPSTAPTASPQPQASPASSPNDPTGAVEQARTSPGPNVFFDASAKGGAEDGAMKDVAAASPSTQSAAAASAAAASVAASPEPAKDEVTSKMDTSVATASSPTAAASPSPSAPSPAAGAVASNRAVVRTGAVDLTASASPVPSTSPVSVAAPTTPTPVNERTAGLLLGQAYILELMDHSGYVSRRGPEQRSLPSMLPSIPVDPCLTTQRLRNRLSTGGLLQSLDRIHLLQQYAVNTDGRWSMELPSGFCSPNFRKGHQAYIADAFWWNAPGLAQAADPSKPLDLRSTGTWKPTLEHDRDLLLAVYLYGFNSREAKDFLRHLATAPYLSFHSVLGKSFHVLEAPPPQTPTSATPTDAKAAAAAGGDVMAGMPALETAAGTPPAAPQIITNCRTAALPRAILGRIKLLVRQLAICFTDRQLPSGFLPALTKAQVNAGRARKTAPVSTINWRSVCFAVSPGSGVLDQCSAQYHDHKNFLYQRQQVTAVFKRLDDERNERLRREQAEAEEARKAAQAAAQMRALLNAQMAAQHAAQVEAQRLAAWRAGQAKLERERLEREAAAKAEKARKDEARKAAEAREQERFVRMQAQRRANEQLAAQQAAQQAQAQQAQASMDLLLRQQAAAQAAHTAHATQTAFNLQQAQAAATAQAAAQAQFQRRTSAQEAAELKARIEAQNAEAERENQQLLAELAEQFARRERLAQQREELLAQKRRLLEDGPLPASLAVAPVTPKPRKRKNAKIVVASDSDSDADISLAELAAASARKKSADKRAKSSSAAAADRSPAAPGKSASKRKSVSSLADEDNASVVSATPSASAGASARKRSKVQQQEREAAAADDHSAPSASAPASVAEDEAAAAAAAAADSGPKESPEERHKRHLREKREMREAEAVAARVREEERRRAALAEAQRDHSCPHCGRGSRSAYALAQHRMVCSKRLAANDSAAAAPAAAPVDSDATNGAEWTAGRDAPEEKAQVATPSKKSAGTGGVGSSGSDPSTPAAPASSGPSSAKRKKFTSRASNGTPAAAPIPDASPSDLLPPSPSKPHSSPRKSQ